MVARRFLKLKDAFERYLNLLLRDFELTSKDLQDPTVLASLGSLSEMTMKEMYSARELVKIDFSSAVKESLQKRYFYDPPTYTSEDLDIIDKALKVLDQHPPHDQRSMTWYSFRQGKLTASDLAKALGEKGDKSKLDLLYQKAMPLQQYIDKRLSFSLDSKPAIKHGKCYEDVAVALYEKKNNVTVREYGCLPHLFIDHLAASPDGIIFSRETNPSYHGRMLEIKCPYSRVINGIIKLEYYMQMQLQLEVCDLEYCDFLECDVRTYGGMGQFLDDSPPDGKSYSLQHDGREKGLLYEYQKKGEKSSSYKYCALGLSNDEVRSWMKATKSEIADNWRLDGKGFVYWKLVEFNIVLVKRDLSWFENVRPELANFWASVQYHRSNGLIEIKEKLGLVAKKPTQLELFLKDRPPDEMNQIKLQNGHPGKAKSKSKNNDGMNILDDLANLEFLDLGDDSDDESSKKKLNPKLNPKLKPKDDLEFLDLDDDSPEPSSVLLIETKVKVKQFKSLVVIKPE